MPQQVPIQALPNQNLSITLDGARYDLQINSSNISCLIKITRDDVVILEGARAVGGSFVIPYQYLEQGNFYFETPNDEVPYYDNFGVTQFLNFLSAAELEALRSGN